MIKLLIVDDESRTREGLSSLILRNNLPVEIVGTASNGMEGLAIARTVLPDIILTDVRMPKLDGIKLSTKVREFSPHCQIIFISGYSDKEYLKSAISLKAVSYVEKPIEEQELLDAVSSAIQIIEKDKFLLEQQRDIFSEKAAIAFTAPNMDKLYWEKLDSLCPDFLHFSCYRTLICQLNYKEISELNTQKVYEQLKLTLSQNCRCFLLAPKKQNIFVIHLCNNTVVSHNVLNHLYLELQHALFGLAELFLAVGNPVTKPDQLYLSYTNAVICLKKLFFIGYNHVCYHKDLDNDMGTSFRPDSLVFPSFAQALTDGNCPEAASIVTKLFHEMRKTIYKFETNSIKNVYYQLLILLDSICKERGFTDIFPHESHFIWETIAKKDTIFALQEYLTDKLSLYSAAIASKKGTSLLVYQIQQYVESHFHEPTLSINKMADSLHFTPAYLCQIFKNETGTTINAYMNTYRIKKATDLLKSKDIKLYEVSFRVGYSDSNYFSRQFKKHAGMTPSEFRKRYVL